MQYFIVALTRLIRLTQAFPYGRYIKNKAIEAGICHLVTKVRERK